MLGDTRLNWAKATISGDLMFAISPVSLTLFFTSLSISFRLDSRSVGSVNMRARALNAPPLSLPVFCIAFSLLWATSGNADDSLFVEQIAPILSQRCLSCHNDQDREGDFSLETREGAFDGGHIVPGKSDSSRLFEVITPIDGQAEMPQDADPIPPEQRELIQKWIDSGAAWPDSMNLEAASVADLDWWSLRPLEQPLVPAVESVAGGFPIHNPIDAFVQHKLSAHGLEANPLADRATLIRRLYFDLIGLPPSPQEIEDFVKDSSPHAYEKLVDRLT